MGDRREETAEQLRDHWHAMVDVGQASPGSGLEDISLGLKESGAWPEDLRDSAMIIDTDIGGDADDALALTVAARCTPQLALVTTSDETGPGEHGSGQRARFARYLLDSLGRSEVPVVAGSFLRGSPLYCVDGLVPNDVTPQDTDVVEAVRNVARASQGPIRWVGMGPLTNLATVLAQAPELAGRLRVTQMGGALRYRDPERAEHNFRLDAPAVHAVFSAVAEGSLAPPEFITSEVTFTPQTEVSAHHPIYHQFATARSVAWAELLTAHLDRWFARFHAESKQHDALTLSAALELPFVDSAYMPLVVDEIGRTISSSDAEGVTVRVSTEAHYEGFMGWLRAKLDPVVEPSGPTLLPSEN